MAVKLDEKSSRAEEADVSHCVSNLIHAFYNGLNIFKKLRERRRKRKGRKESQPADAAASEEKQLSKSLKKGPQALAETYDACYKQAGHSFAKGDAIAHAALAETLVKLNTGLVAIIASFLNHDQKGGKAHVNINYHSLTNLSDASRKEALQSMTQLYQRLSQSQLQIQHFGHHTCTRCGSSQHADCSARSSSTSTSNSTKDKKKQTTSRQRVTGPTITRMPTKSSRQPQLVVVRPRPSSRKSASQSPSSSKSPSPSSSAHTSPVTTPLPLYIAEEPFELETNGIITGLLGAPMPPLAGNGRRRKDSFTQHDPRHGTWPDAAPCSSAYPYGAQEHLHLPAPRLPSFKPAPRRQAASQQKTWSPPPPPPPPAPSDKNTAALPVRRRMDKMTPSAYTFASDSTKLGEIPQRSWTTPWDYDEADRLNHEARTAVPIVVIDEKVGRKKGIFKWMRN